MRKRVTIAGRAVPRGRVARIDLPVARLPLHTMLHVPLTVVNGTRDGPRLWLSAALHGDEINGVEIVRQVLERIDPGRMSGLLLAVPVVNVFGFVHGSRYLPDRRDLNRSFPGSKGGSLASQLAHLFTTEVVARCSHGVDLHTAAPPRANLPQVRGDLTDPETRRCAMAFGAPVMVQTSPPPKTLRATAKKRGIAIIVYEAGEPHRFDDAAIVVGVDGVLRVMAALGMIDAAEAPPPNTSLEAIDRKWVRARQSGVLRLGAALGQRVQKGETVAEITDPLGDAMVRMRSPIDGLIIGVSSHGLVHRGDAILHVAATPG